MISDTQKLVKSRFTDFASNYFSLLNNLIGKLDLDKMGEIFENIESARERGSTIYVAGNGGSASTASHINTDWSIGTRLRDTPLKVLSLTDNNAIITAVANDYGYDQVFSRQLKIHAGKDDILLCISASGNSENLVAAAQVATELGMKTVGFLGFDGGILKDLLDVSITVETPIGQYGPVEDMHLIMNHVIANFFLTAIGDV